MSPLAYAESQSNVADFHSVGPYEDGRPPTETTSHRYSLKERLSISGADGGGDQSEDLGAEEIILWGMMTLAGASDTGLETRVLKSDFRASRCRHTY